MRLRPLALLGLAASTVVLSGCGTVHPGAAVTVGDSTVSLRTVDQTTQLYCQAYLDKIDQAGQVIPMRYMRQFVAASYAQRELGRQLAAYYGVDTTPEYGKFVASARQQFASKPTDVQDAAVTVESGDPYLQSIQLAVGAKLLEQEGHPTSDSKKQLARGKVATHDYLIDHPMTADPVLGMSFVDGDYQSDDADTSFALSKTATSGKADTPDAAYTNALPSSQKCGSGQASDAQAGQPAQ